MTVSVATPVERSGEPAAVWLALAVVAAVAGVFLGDLRSLWDLWLEPQRYSHGILVAALVPWLVWRERARLGVAAAAPVLGAGLVLLALGALWLFTRAASVEVVRYVLLPVFAWTAVLGVLGRRSAEALAFPLAWFWFAVPAWDALTGFLQHTTALVSHAAVTALGIPAHLEGDLVTIPAGTFEIAAGCGGLKFFVVAIAVAALYGHLERWSVRHRATLLAAAAAVAMVTNWLRVTVIIVAGQMTAMQSPLISESHYLFGWCLFAAALSLFLFAARHLYPRPAAPHAAAVRGTRRASSHVLLRRLGVVLAVLVAAPACYFAEAQRAEHVAARASLALPAGRNGWSGPLTQEFGWRPVFLRPSGEARGAYVADAGTVFADVTTYATEQRGAKLIGYGSDPTGPAGSAVFEDHRRSLEPASAPGPAVRDLVVRTPDGEYWRIWQWYQVGAEMTPDQLHAKLRQGLRGLVGHLGSGAVSIAVRCRADCRSGEGDDLLYQFLHDMREALESAALGGPREY